MPAQSYRSVAVSCLLSDHSFLTAAGRPSPHALGRTVDNHVHAGF